MAATKCRYEKLRTDAFFCAIGLWCWRNLNVTVLTKFFNIWFVSLWLLHCLCLCSDVLYTYQPGDYIVLMALWQYTGYIICICYWWIVKLDNTLCALFVPQKILPIQYGTRNLIIGFYADGFDHVLNSCLSFLLAFLLQIREVTAVKVQH